MDKDVAKLLLPLINNVELYGVLVDYAKNRIEYHKTACIAANTFDEVRKSQGAIRELSRVVTLRDEVIQTLKGE